MTRYLFDTNIIGNATIAHPRRLSPGMAELADEDVLKLSLHRVQVVVEGRRPQERFERRCREGLGE